MKKYFVTILLFVIAANVIAQNKIITKYYDSVWQPIAKEKANFYSEFKPESTLYKVTSYYYPSMKLYGKSTFADTLFKKGVGLMERYYETGKIKDSSYFFDDTLKNFSYSFTYYDDGKLENVSYANNQGVSNLTHFYKSGRICATADFDKEKKIYFNSKGYDENGNLIPNFIFQKQAEFPGGQEGWTNYLIKNLQSDIPVQNGAPAGMYEVVIKFDVDEGGYVVNVRPENNPGYGTMQEAMRLFINSPRWKPAIQFNKPVLAHQRQKITFQVSEGKKRFKLF